MLVVLLLWIHLASDDRFILVLVVHVFCLPISIFARYKKYINGFYCINVCFFLVKLESKINNIHLFGF